MNDAEARLLAFNTSRDWPRGLLPTDIPDVLDELARVRASRDQFHDEMANAAEERDKLRAELATYQQLYMDEQKKKVRVLDPATATEMDYWPANVALAEVAKEEVASRLFWEKEIAKKDAELEAALKVCRISDSIFERLGVNSVRPTVPMRALRDATYDWKARFGGRADAPDESEPSSAERIAAAKQARRAFEEGK